MCYTVSLNDCRLKHCDKKEAINMDHFELISDYKPMGDQPQAIDALCDGVQKGYKEQTLLGVTGSGKTFTMANVIAKVQKPTLILAHNKTLARSAVF